MSKHPDYTRALNTSINVLKKYNIDKVPLNLMSIVKQTPGLKLYTYSSFSQNFGCSVNEIIELFQSELGALARDPRKNKFVIYYNDTKNNKGLDRFTIAHELGHYFLGHFSLITGEILSRGGFSNKQYKAIEKEANCFARNLLAPVPLYNRVRKDPLTFTWRVMQTFVISHEATTTRRKFLQLDSYRITKEHTKYFNTYKMPCFDYCQTCGTPIFELFTYCPICGNDNIKSIWDTKFSERKKNMVYKEYDVHEDSKKLKVCLECGNERTNIEGEYCQICGKPLANMCDTGDMGIENSYACGKPVPSNARYCPHCGSPTVFLTNGVLEEWTVENTENQIPELSAITFDEGLQETQDDTMNDFMNELPSL